MMIVMDKWSSVFTLRVIGIVAGSGGRAADAIAAGAAASALATATAAAIPRRL